MSPSLLLVIIALGVAIGVASAPFIGKFFDVAGIFVIIGGTILVVYVLIRISMQRVKESIGMYFRSIPKAWGILTCTSNLGKGFSLKQRLDGLVILFVCLVWGIVVVGLIYLMIFNLWQLI